MSALFGKKDKQEDKDAEGAGAEGTQETQGNQGTEGGSGGKDAGKKEGGVGSMASGDYMIHIFVEKLKEVNTPEGETYDPMFVVECLEQKAYSSAKEKVGPISEVTYSEHIFIEVRDVDKQHAEDGKIMIKLMDKGFLKDKLIGQFELDMSYVYLKPGHVVQHKWFAFSNPNGEDYAKIQCYAKLSIAVTREGDTQPEIKEDASGVEDPDVMMSPALSPKFYQVKIRFYAGHDLPMMDASMGFLGKEKIDAYLKLDFKGKKYKTPTIKYYKNDAPILFNTEFWLPCQLPVAVPRIPIRIMDYDEIGSDELAATFELITKEIIENKHGDNGRLHWRNLYGSPVGQSNSNEKRLMNEHPDFASEWKGRILVNIIAEPTDKPLAKTVKITDEALLENAAKKLQKKKYNIIMQVGQAVALPKTDAYKIKVTVGGHAFILDPKEQKKPVTSKRYGQLEKLEFESYNQTLDDFESVFVQLMEKDTPICFFKSDIKNFIDPDPERMEWYQFVPDKCVKKVKEPPQVGQFSFKMTLEEASPDNVPFKERKYWKKVNKRLTAVKVRAYIYQARDLPAADAEGTSDPYIKVWDTTATQKKSKQTAIVEDNCNPLFYECIELAYDVEDKDDLYTYPPFIFDLYDYDDDLFDSTDDFLCRCIVEPEECALLQEKDFEKCKAHNQEHCQIPSCANREIPFEPRWHPCYYTPGTEKCGELLVSFSVTSDDYPYSVPDPNDVDLDALVEKAEMTVNMNILGLRNLLSPGILPVKKAFINFAIKSMVPPNGASISNKMTTPNQAGPNPTMNNTMKFNVPLPVKKLYCPRLTCSVYDNIFAGWNQPLIGVFVLDVGQLRDDLTDERTRETAHLEKIIQTINELANAGADLESYAIQTEYQPTGGNVLTTDIQGTEQDMMEESQINASKQIFAATKKKARKGLNKEVNKQVSEVLGANEDEGEQSAIIQKKNQLALAEQTQKEITRKMTATQRSSVSGSLNGEQIKPQEAIQKVQELQDLQARIAEDERKREQEEMIKKGEDVSSIIQMPQYKLDPRLKVDRESKKYPEEIYEPLGWDEDSNTHRKHYRKFYNKELENVPEIFETQTPFNTFELKKGQTRGAKTGMFSTAKKDASGEADTVQVAGIFKAIIEVDNDVDRAKYQYRKNNLLVKLDEALKNSAIKHTGKPIPISIQSLEDPTERVKFELIARELGLDHLNISKALTNLNSDEILKSALLKLEKCIVRFYAIEGFNMQSRDNGSDSDTYLKLICNGKVFDERDNYQLDEPNPKFYKMYEFEAYFPGSSPLTIEVWDYDMVFGDELVGKSVLDLEDRYFTLDWMSLKDKPIEYRTLYHPSSKMGQGVVKCWTEIVKTSADADKIPLVWDISPKPAYQIEVRICILNCVDIPMMDAEGTCDAFFKGFFDSSEEVQETDTHYRNQDGKPDFQYRTVFKTTYPRPKNTTKFSIQGYDRDFFKSNDMIGEATIELNDIMEDVSLIKNCLTYNQKYYQDVIKPKYPNDKTRKLEFDPKDDNKIWLQMWAKNKKGKLEKRGKIGVNIQILPQGSADKNPVGKARDTPNHSPSLPAPEGRLELSFNPVKMFNQLVGPALRRKIYLALCCALCVALCVMVAPQVFVTLIINAISGK